MATLKKDEKDQVEESSNPGESDNALPDVFRFTCSVFSTSHIDKAEVVRLLSEETSTITVLDKPAVFDYLTAQSFNDFLSTLIAFFLFYKQRNPN